MKFSKYEDVIENISGLPPLPQVALKVIKLLEDNDFNFAELVRVISKDAGITASILKMANSALFSPKSQISNLTQAISFLGVKNIKNLVISLSTKTIFEAGQVRLLDRQIWEHSLSTAIYGRIIAVKYYKSLSEEVFLLGLMHDIGQVLMSKHMDRYEEAVQSMFNETSNSIDVENFYYGFNHTKFGELLAQFWNLPEMYVDVISNHHTPHLSNFKELAYIVAFAHNKAKSMNIGITSYVDPNISDYQEKLSLKQDELEEIDIFFKDIFAQEKEIFKL